MKIKNKKWYKLDNAAKIFPPNINKKDSKVFRFACELYEDIDKTILQNALDKTLEEYPVFLSSLKKGLFWYYLETSSVTPLVTEENKAICDIIDKDLLFRVSYYKKRINLEVNHSLTDGTGTLAFLKSLVSNYLIEKYNIKSKIIMDTTSVYEKEIDSFEKYYSKNKKINLTKSIKAYNLKGEMYPENRLKIIEGVVSTKKIIELAKNYKTTVTVYLTSVLIKSIGETMSVKERKKPIVVTVPVNLRKYFKSNTVRNFFNTISVRYKMNGNDKIEQIIESVDKQFKQYLQIDNLNKQMNSFAVFENVFIIRLVPVFIKDVVLKYFHSRSRKEQTIALSNIGIVEMPKELQKYIKLFDVFASTDCTQICMCSYLDNMVLSFTTHFVDSEIEKNFFKILNKNDIEIVINTNIVEDDDYEEVL
ncbi:MAG: hypothetical protein E7174_02760 [Firmicutes bacterium]|nr:hypothetical protein [Bacillota bacterium]